ncbi:hypothetical protein ACNI65_24240 [Roseateles sp. So40a]|uniref:hypothetical protein n=1 Tax=Roseateles sp. So40a TaxID=3400226 RepID=UPI003A85FB5C
MTAKTFRLSPGVVVTDTNVLINFLRIEQLGLLGRVPELRFEVPQQVMDEVTWEAQAAALAAALEAGELHPCEASDVEISALYSSLLKRIESGEAACIAIACVRGQSVATDEKGNAGRIAHELLGRHRLLRTEELIKRCIQAELISVSEADEFKATLARNRYDMKFASFADLAAA